MVQLHCQYSLQLKKATLKKYLVMIIFIVHYSIISYAKWHSLPKRVISEVDVIIVGQTFGEVDELYLRDGETYYAIVRATNLLNYTVTMRSDGITVRLEPLVPGDVRDGHIIGTDINFQPSITTLSVNWDHFGRERQREGIIQSGKSDLSTRTLLRN